MILSRTVAAAGWTIVFLIGALLLAPCAAAENPAAIRLPANELERSDLRLLGKGIAGEVAAGIVAEGPIVGGVSITEDHPHFKRLQELGLLVRGPKRSWGPEQATGEPDTIGAGDITTAWASATQDDQDEWLEATFADMVKIAEIHVVETYNPGALFKVTTQTDGGMEVVLWKGEDPTPKGVADGRGTSIVKPGMGAKTNRVRIHLASKDVPGWNEIDAIGIKDSEGKMHWARHVTASSNYAGGPDPGWTIDPKAAVERVLKLEKEIDELKAQLEKLKTKP